MENSNPTGETSKKTIKISEVLEMLDNYKTRKEIGKFYGLTSSETSQLFKHDKLKGKRTKVKPSFVVIDDLEPETPTSVEPEASTSVETEPETSTETETTEDSTSSEDTVTIASPPEPVKRAWG